jgi:hypothetical protein
MTTTFKTESELHQQLKGLKQRLDEMRARAQEQRRDMESLKNTLEKDASAKNAASRLQQAQ